MAKKTDNIKVVYGAAGDGEAATVTITYTMHVDSDVFMDRGYLETTAEEIASAIEAYHDDNDEKVHNMVVVLEKKGK